MGRRSSQLMTDMVYRDVKVQDVEWLTLQVERAAPEEDGRTCASFGAFGAVGELLASQTFSDRSPRRGVQRAIPAQPVE